MKKKLTSIFSQHPNINHNNFNSSSCSAKVVNNDHDEKNDEKIAKKQDDVDDDDEDEGRGSLSEKSDKNIIIGNCCDKKMEDKSNNHKFEYNVKSSSCSDKMLKNNNEIKVLAPSGGNATTTTTTAAETKSTSTKNSSNKQNNLDLAETIGTFTLPRIALNKAGSSYDEDIGFVDNKSAVGSQGTVRSSIAPTNLPTATASHHRPRRVSTSHYSTEKSASSGYYGSNLYSAGGSSVDEHIYSEPVIIENVEVHTKKIHSKERKCLASLNKSITCLESCLESEKKPSDKTKKELPSSIVNRRKASLPRDGTIPRPVWPGEASDDSLTNINLDAFNLQANDLIQLHTPKSEKRQSTFTNPDSGKGTSEGASEYMDMDYHETRNILVNIRSKLETLLEQHRSTMTKTNPFKETKTTGNSELEQNIISLRNDLEKYLTVMTEKSELELQRFSTTMSKDSRIQTVTKAFDRRQDFDAVSLRKKQPVTAYSCYSSQIKPPLSRKPSIEKGDFIMTCNDQINPFTATPCDTVIQIISDASAGGESSDSLNCDGNKPQAKKCNRHPLSQMQKNLAFSQLLNDSFNNNAKFGDDRERMLNEWHRDKPSIWEMYYGTNRYSSKIEQGLIREYKYPRNNCAMNVSYPSTRPESDFTLDMPRAEELREKMEREKIFRSRCRLTTYFLGLMVFLLTVMIVSLVLTRGKRMFGSML
ncbi:uncharacterized protein LOC134828891 [Culicoides brevitarsis]|uniref:uncharacterized protein LOC134828891 n=1 Tax=Culicoides brevitarsis TaxID=469753 RepID=UPI00307C0DA3